MRRLTLGFAFGLALGLVVWPLLLGLADSVPARWLGRAS